MDPSEEKLDPPEESTANEAAGEEKTDGEEQPEAEKEEEEIVVEEEEYEEEEIVEEEEYEEEEVIDEEMEEEIIEEIVEDEPGSPAADEGTADATPEDVSDYPPSTGVHTDDAVVADEENQMLQFTPTPPTQPTTKAARPTTTPEVKKEGDGTGYVWYWIACLLICGLLGGGSYVGYFLVNENRDDAPSLFEDEDVTASPSAAPTAGFTTPFSPVQGGCSLNSLKNPHVIDQCACVGEIQNIPADVRARYEAHLEDFIPTLYADYDDAIDSCSPRNQALVWLASANDFEFDYDERVERFALATVFAALGGRKWRTSADWLGRGSVCTWEGVVCSDSDMVETIVLSGNNLAGSMPPEVALLDNMLQLFASRNAIEGPIPQALFSISALQLLDLSFNAFTGPVPPAVGNAKLLKDLNLENNRLSGRLSQQLGSAESLEALNLGANQLVGGIPPQIFELSNLKRLDLRSNLLSGVIPDGIVALQNLTSLVLGPNSFSGDIPASVAELTNLESLTLSGLPLMGGQLPASYARNLKNLTDLTISGTNVGGNIEPDFGNLPKLARLDLSKNQLRGTIPMELGNLGNLTVLDLSRNFLDGQVPVSLGGLTKITELSLNDNLLRDGVPNQFSGLTELQKLRLDGTLISGRVAQEICDLRQTNLTTFIVDCFDSSLGSGVICEIPDCCTGCRT